MKPWIALVVVVVVGWLLALYNGLIRRRVLVTESWAQIDVELGRRHDLIPNLIATVKGYAAHEQVVLDAVTTARSGATSLATASPARRAVAEDVLGQVLLRLNAVTEAYPDLKASANYLSLQRELTDTEDRIAAARRLYNGNVRSLNIALRTIPTNAIGSIAGMRPAEFFDVRDAAARDAPRIVM